MARVFTIFFLGMAVGTTMAACSNSPPVAVASASAPIPIDGTYRGLMQLSRGDAITCGNENPITLQVKDHTFNYRLDQPQAEWRPVINFAAAIERDGSFNAQTGPNSLSGNIQNGTIQGQIIGDICGFKFIADQVGTW